MPDADIDNVVTSLLGAAFGSSGERCMALSVAVAIGDEVADVVIDKLTQEMKKIEVRQLCRCKQRLWTTYYPST